MKRTIAEIYLLVSILLIITVMVLVVLFYGRNKFLMKRSLKKTGHIISQGLVVRINSIMEDAYLWGKEINQKEIEKGKLTPKNYRRTKYFCLSYMGLFRGLSIFNETQGMYFNYSLEGGISYDMKEIPHNSLTKGMGMNEKGEVIIPCTNYFDNRNVRLTIDIPELFRGLIEDVHEDQLSFALVVNGKTIFTHGMEALIDKKGCKKESAILCFDRFIKEEEGVRCSFGLKSHNANIYVVNSHQKNIFWAIMSLLILFFGLIIFLLRSIRKNRSWQKRFILEMSPIPLLILEKEKIAIVSESAVELFGAKNKANIENLRLFDLPEKDETEKEVKKLTKCYEETLDKGKSGCMVNLERLNGKDFAAEIDMSSLKYEGKQYVQVLIKDISERISYENALKRVLLVSEKILDSMPFGVFVTNCEGKIIRANKYTHRVLGIEPQKIINEKYDKYFCERGEGVFEQERELGEKGLIECFMLPPEKEPVPILKSCMPLHIGDRNLLLEAFVDIRKQKLAERIIKEQKEDLQMSQKIAKLGNWKWYPMNNRFTYSDAFADICSLPRRKDIGISDFINKVVVSQYRKKLWKYLEKAKKGEVGDFIEYKVFSTSGYEKWVRTEPPKIMYDGEKTSLILGTLQDISKQKKQEEELLKAKEEAESANRMKSIFLANMSHEIRTPLNSILGFSRIIKKRFRHSDQFIYNSAKTIYNSGQNLLNLLNDILDLSKIEAGRMGLTMKPLIVQSIIEDVIKGFVPKIREKGLGCEIEFQENLPAFFLDQLRLRQIIFNLIGNAVKFTEKGHISIKIGFKESAEYDDRGDLGVKVKDTGIGIDRTQQKLIFKTFRQQKGQENKFGGTGLGLTISKRLAIMMGGDIRVYSEEGKGAEFQLVLLNVKTVEAKTFSLKRVKNNIVLNDKTVLIISKDDNMQNILCPIVKETGADVILVSSEEVTTEIFEESILDLMIVDLPPPAEKEIDMLRTIKNAKKLSKIPILMLTAGNLGKKRKEIIEMGYKYFVPKPIDEEDLKIKIQEVIRKGAMDMKDEKKTALEVLPPSGVGKEELVHLRERYLEKCFSLLRSGNFSEIKSLASQLLAYSHKSGNRSIKAFAENMLMDVENVDFIKVKSDLRYFIKVLQKE